MHFISHGKLSFFLVQSSLNWISRLEIKRWKGRPFSYDRFLSHTDIAMPMPKTYDANMSAKPFAARDVLHRETKPKIVTLKTKTSQRFSKVRARTRSAAFMHVAFGPSSTYASRQAQSTSKTQFHLFRTKASPSNSVPSPMMRSSNLVEVNFHA